MPGKAFMLFLTNPRVVSNLHKQDMSVIDQCHNINRCVKSERQNLKFLVFHCLKNNNGSRTVCVSHCDPESNAVICGLCCLHLSGLADATESDRYEHLDEIKQGRSDRDSSPCPTQPQSHAQTPARRRHMHRLPRWLGAENSNRRRGQRRCRST